MLVDVVWISAILYADFTTIKEDFFFGMASPKKSQEFEPKFICSATVSFTATANQIDTK